MPEPIIFPEGEFFACDDPEQLSCTDPIDALIEFVDNFLPAAADVRAELNRIGTITVTAYRRAPVDLPKHAEREAEALAENVADRWNEEHGGPDGDLDASDADVMALAKALQPALLAFFQAQKSWNYESCGEVELEPDQVEALLRESTPSWFEEAPLG